jgi:hypothetical protein
LKYKIILYGDWGLGIGDWGLGIEKYERPTSSMGIE